MTSSEDLQRGALPIADRPYGGPVMYDAHDPDADFAAIEPVAPPEGAPNVLVILLDDVGFGASSAFGGPVHTPNAERLAAGWPQVHALPHDGAVLADPRRADDRPQPPPGRHGQHHRAGDRGARLHVDAPQHLRDVPGDPEAQRLRDRALRQVPRGSGLGDLARRPVRSLAVTGQRLRALLRLPRRRDEPVVPGALSRAPTPVEPWGTPEEGYHLLPRHDRRRDRLDPPAEDARARQAVHAVLRARRHARAAPRAPRMGRQVQGPVRRRAGTLQRERTFARQKELGVIPPDCRAHAAPREIPAWDDMDPADAPGAAPARWRSTPATWSTPTIMSAC